MNITLVKTRRSDARGKCCEQVFYEKMDTLKVKALMKTRAQKMPCNKVVAYCASCIIKYECWKKLTRFFIL